MARILLQNVGLTFRAQPTSHLTWKDLLLRGLFRRSQEQPRKIRALRHINLHAGHGERIGIIGHNGAGKSTLLKVLAGIYPPSKGHRQIEGRISSLFDLSLGFEPEGTGWENIRYRGYLQGETPQTLEPKVDAIAEFSELGDHLNLPVRYYSTGMLVRLAFSIATAIEPEILLIDEILSAGDLAFQQKARKRMEKMMSKARLIVMVSHDLRSVEKLCDRVLWLDRGMIHREGPGAEIIEAYTATCRPAQGTSSRKSSARKGASRAVSAAL